MEHFNLYITSSGYIYKITNTFQATADTGEVTGMAEVVEAIVDGVQVDEIMTGVPPRLKIGPFRYQGMTGLSKNCLVTEITST